MNRRQRFAARAMLVLGVGLVLGLLAAPAVAQHADPNVAHTDGYVTSSPDGRCMVLKAHDGSMVTLVGRRYGLINNDHVRLEGRLVGDNHCGGQGGFEVTSVQTIWADDRHRTTYYDHLKDGDFRGWAERNRPRELERWRGEWQPR